MSPRGIKIGLFSVLVLMALIRHDLWWWYDSTPVLSIPIGLVYHALFCLAVSFIMALLVKFAWPLLDAEQPERASTGAPRP